MSTAPFPKAVRPELVPSVRRLPERLPAGAGAFNLTIRRISKSHHGRTLQMLGHAAEYLVNHRRFQIAGSASTPDDEAVRILMRLSSAVFREYAESVRVRRPVEDLVMGCAGWLFELQSECRLSAGVMLFSEDGLRPRTMRVHELSGL